MKIAAISDIHGQLPDHNMIPDCDALLIAGDICGGGNAYFQNQWLNTQFRWWLNQLPMPVFGVAGNHDWPFYEIPNEVPKDLNWTYLEDSSVEFEGLKIYGTPWQKVFYDWAFNLKESELAQKWSMIPDDTDILIAHGPPKFFGDLVVEGTHEGSPSMLERIIQVKPKLVVFGHIHNGRGEYDHEGVKLANVTLLNERYKMVYEPWTYEIEV